ncbi:MAG: hypothetical protein FJ318_09820 [SAR202 cluster bacterium]|nr:hypothetical protein [SAR202 cluster bacterium]
MILFNRVGRRDLLADEAPLAFTPQQAMAAISIVAAIADGTVTDDEVARIVGNLADKRMFRGQRVDDMGRLLNGVSKVVQQHGAADVIDAAKHALARELRETAFALVADLLYAGGHIEPREKHFLDDLQEALEIDDVLAIKNRG